MSDTDRDVVDRERETVRKARTNALEAQMEEFLRTRESDEDLRELRRRVSDGSMADLVVEERTDRV